MLSQYLQRAIRAYNWTSFNPEKIGARVIADYSAELKADLEELGENCGNYERKYKAHFLGWIHSQSNCASSFVTGSANFPVAKMAKYRRWEENKYKEFRAWRDRYFSAVNRIPVLSPEDDLEAQIIKLDKLIEANELGKELNKKIKKCKDKAEIKTLLTESGIDEKTIIRMFEMNERFKVRIWFNSNAPEIKRVTERINILKVRIARKESFEEITFDGGKITIENDRVCIYHDEKPSREITDKLKRRGFRWSPSWSCWCRKHTGNAVYDAKNLCCEVAKC